MQLLDFTYKIEDETFEAFKEYEGKEIYLLSKNLQLSASASGKPAFLLEFVRGITPFSKPPPYALMEMQFEPPDLNESILSEISDKWSSRQIQYADIDSGYLTLTLQKKDVSGDDGNSDKELNTPIPLSKMPLSRLRIVEQFNEEYMNLFHSVLQSGILLMSAKGWYCVSGYAPPVESTVNFNPAKLTKSVKTFISNEDGCISHDDLFLLFRDKINLLPIQISVKEKEKVKAAEPFAMSLAARYLNYFCEPLPLLSSTNDINFKFNELATKEGEFTWDLLKPQVVKHYTTYTLKGLDTMLRMINEGSFPEYTQTRIIEVLPTGFIPVSVYHPFFMLPVGIRQAGIKISAPPIENLRLQAINETITFDTGTAKKTVILRFAPLEKLEFNVLPFVITEENGVTSELHGESFTSNNNILYIQPDQFPLHFVSFKCTEALMEAADIKLEITGDDKEKDPLPSTTFSKEQPDVMYAFSNKNLKDWRAKVTASEIGAVGNNEAGSVNEAGNNNENGNKNKGGSKTITKTFSLNNDLKIDLATFDSFGSHSVKIRLQDTNSGLTAIDLLPENREELPENITTIALSQNKPEQTWHWYSNSLFRPGFRYRLPLSDNKWSEVISHNIKELIIPPNNQNMKTVNVFEEIAYYPNTKAEGQYLYYPTTISSQKDGNGSPMISLIGAGENWFLLVSSVWQAGSESLDELAKKLVKEEKIINVYELKLAPIEVKKAELILITQQKEQVLSTSATSGYYPFSAVFNVTVNNEQQKLIAPAFTGQAGTLIVRYTGLLNYSEPIIVKGDVSDWFTDKGTENIRIIK